MKVKIIGAGSIGNHHAQAARRLGWEVVVIDKDPRALTRMREVIYPSRYGPWDESIQLYTTREEPKGDFDVIAIGTPPDVRMLLALEALKEKPRLLLLEKPLAVPNDRLLEAFVVASRTQSETKVLVGYDHAVSASITKVAKILKQGAIGELLTLDVEFREHWGGIFKAHPWLSGPADSYLGFSHLGGGASGEHSHALHLANYLAGVAGWSPWRSVGFRLAISNSPEPCCYDKMMALVLEAKNERLGRVVQDVITRPTRKWASLQGTEGRLEWHCGGVPEGDLVVLFDQGGELGRDIFPKKRPDDFYAEFRHLEMVLSGELSAADSPLSLKSGLSVMDILSAVWRRPDAGSLLLPAPRA